MILAAVGGTTGGGDAMERTRVTIKHGSLVGPVLSRVIGIHAARAPLPMDRLQDALLIADAIAAQAPAYAMGDQLPVALRGGDGRLEIRVGPLREGGAQRVVESADVAEVANVVQRLTNNVRIRSGNTGSEYLVLTIGESLTIVAEPPPEA